MGIMDFAAAAARNTNRPFNSLQTPANEQKNSKVWANWGYEINGRFVSLPLGQGIDTMQPKAVRGQNKDFVELTTAQNDFLKMLQEMGDKLAPGQEIELPATFKIRLRRVNEKIEVAQGDNPYSVDLASMLAGAKPIVAPQPEEHHEEA